MPYAKIVDEDTARCYFNKGKRVYFSLVDVFEGNIWAKCNRFKYMCWDNKTTDLSFDELKRLNASRPFTIIGGEKSNLYLVECRQRQGQRTHLSTVYQ